MNSPIHRLVHESENRYLNADECSAITRYASSIPARLAIALEMENIEVSAVRDYMTRVAKKYPSVKKQDEESRTRSEHDGALTARVMVQSMVLDDMSYLDERLLYWFRTIQTSLGFTPEFVSDSYTFLKQAFVERLSMNGAKTMAPYFDHVIEVLSDFQAPATPRA